MIRSLRQRIAGFAPLSVVLLALFSAGCDVYDRPRRPLPADFLVTTLDGQVLTPEAMRGAPWVINIWVPG